MLHACLIVAAIVTPWIGAQPYNFEIDGNVSVDGGAGFLDWASGDLALAPYSGILVDLIDGNDTAWDNNPSNEPAFTLASPVEDWFWELRNVVPPEDIFHYYFRAELMSVNSTNDTAILYYGLDQVNDNPQIGVVIWFLQEGLQLITTPDANGNLPFDGEFTDGDLAIMVFANNVRHQTSLWRWDSNTNQPVLLETHNDNGAPETDGRCRPNVEDRLCRSDTSLCFETNDGNAFDLPWTPGPDPGGVNTQLWFVEGAFQISDLTNLFDEATAIPCFQSSVVATMSGGNPGVDALTDFKKGSLQDLLIAGSPFCNTVVQNFTCVDGDLGNISFKLENKGIFELFYTIFLAGSVDGGINLQLAPSFEGSIASNEISDEFFASDLWNDPALEDEGCELKVTLTVLLSRRDGGPTQVEVVECATCAMTTSSPTNNPTEVTSEPTPGPSVMPTPGPVGEPTKQPTGQPTTSPTNRPTRPPIECCLEPHCQGDQCKSIFCFPCPRDMGYKHYYNEHP